MDMSDLLLERLPSLLPEDHLFGDDFLQLLTSDLGMDVDIPFVPEVEVRQPASSSEQSTETRPLAPASPASDSQHSTPSSSASQQPIYLPNATACRRGAPASKPKSVAGLPALAGVWRTVTTATESQPASPGPAPSSAAPLPPAPQLLAQLLPSLATPLLPPTLTSAPSDSLNETAGSRPRRQAPKQVAVKSVQKSVQIASEDMDSASDDSTDEDGAPTAVTKAGSKRKAPDVDWRSITDPAERRRQRRLAKNRVTAARSRERKKSQWAVMEDKLSAMEAENRSLREMLDAATQENKTLRAQLEAAGVLGGSNTAPGLPGAADAADLRGSGHNEPAVLALVLAILLLCVTLPSSEQASVVLGSATPVLLLLAALLSTQRSSKSWSAAHANRSEKQQVAAADAALQLLNEQQHVAIKCEAPSSPCGFNDIHLAYQSLVHDSWTMTKAAVGKAAKLARHGLPRLRDGAVPKGLFVV